MSDLHSLPLSELLALAGRAVAAEAQLEQIRAAVGTAGRGSTSPAPSRPRRAARAEPRRREVKPARKPRKAAKAPKVISRDRPCSGQPGGPCKNGRCGLCREARAGGKPKPAPALKPAPQNDGPRCDGAWMARARMKFKQQPAVEFLPGVQTVLKRCAAGDWPLLSEVPAVIR